MFVGNALARLSRHVGAGKQENKMCSVQEGSVLCVCVFLQGKKNTPYNVQQLQQQCKSILSSEYCH